MSDQFSTRLLDQSIEKRKKLFQSTQALRLVNGHGDHLKGLTVDCYHKHFVVQIFSDTWERSIDQVVDHLQKIFDPNYLIVKWRHSPDGRSLDSPRTKVFIEKTSAQTIVVENGLKFSVDCNDAVNTGLFLDMRENRKKMGHLAKGKSVLNTFAYTCSFGVYARHFGAKQVLNIDISKKALKRGEENYALNELTYSDFIVDNTEEFMARGIKKDRHYDLIILDPPSFSRYGNKIFSVTKKMPFLIEQAIRLLNKEGAIFISTNCSEISSLDLKRYITEESRKCQRLIKNMESLNQGPDFPGSGSMKESYLAALLVSYR
jgi:23S rRNA (cytosine1962-C5)-methyltransferase